MWTTSSFGQAARDLRLTWIAVALGLLFTALTLAPSYISGGGAYWQAPSGDVAASQIGWFYYAHDAWRFPLFAIGNYHLPEGTNLQMSGGLPLFALPAKLLFALVWPNGADPPIFMGWWVALCLLLQAIAAGRLLRALDVRAPLQYSAGIVILCWLPMLLLRFGQPTMMAQFFILAALEGYVRAKRHGLGRRHWIVLCALPVVGLLVQPYLAVMCAVPVLATILDAWRDHRLDLAGVLRRLLAMAAASLVVMWVCGFFGGVARNFGDYGEYSLNLASPWMPFPDTLSGRWLGTGYASITGLNQWEGGCYLGAGALLLCVAALPALRDWRGKARRHAALLVLLIVLLVFAVSNRIGFGTHELLHIPLPECVISWLSTLRGSGRFAWVAVYALLAAAVTAIMHRYRARTAAAVLVAAAILQVADVGPMQWGVRAASAGPAASTIEVAAWQQLIAAHSSVFQFPSFECGGLYGNSMPATRWRELEIDWITARLDKPINSAYLARATKDCDRERRETETGPLRPGTLYLYRSTEDIGAFLAQHRADLSRCGNLDDVVVCSPDMNLTNLR